MSPIRGHIASDQAPKGALELSPRPGDAGATAWSGGDADRRAGPP